MNTQAMVERLFPMLITGDRNGARSTVQEWMDAGLVPEVLTQESEEHTSELQSHSDLVCRLLLEKKKNHKKKKRRKKKKTKLQKKKKKKQNSNYSRT